MVFVAWMALDEVIICCFTESSEPSAKKNDGPRQAQGRVAVWMRRALHREVLREFARCRHQALDRALLRPTASYAGDPEECRRADGSPQEPGIGNVFDGSGDRAAFAGAGGRSRGA